MITGRQKKILRLLIREELMLLKEAINPEVAIALIGLIPTLATLSDRRLKHDILPMGKSPTGINIYEFSFEPAGQRYRGVMAQEILDTHPNAVVINDDGFYAVRYSEIDADFDIVPLEEF
ncbi:MAG: hypothetical protein CMB80_03455 [Flammeovirgaceae bacterium]|nr:hypothetical protein [Flammeovirgaceae bacterium]|tara:strand:+ start:5902 stop:6261 length:360 start_codon:yes stop_codon:yes gene_type:complete